MAYDPDNHAIDPKTGFLVHKDTGHMVGIEQAPAAKVHHDKEWPKWVPLNESYVERVKLEPAPAVDGDGKAPLAPVLRVHGFTHYHVNRGDNVVTVPVHDEEQAQLAAGTYKAPDPKDAAKAAHHDEATQREVHADFERAKAEQEAALAKKTADDQAKAEADEVARRVAEKQEIEARNKEAADKLAADAADRVAAAVPPVVPNPGATGA